MFYQERWMPYKLKSGDNMQIYDVSMLPQDFMQFGDNVHFIVSGSARLEMMRKIRDSPAGRYFAFR